MFASMPSLILPTGLDHAHPTEIVRWAVDHAGLARVVVTASFEDAVLAHVATTAAPGIEIVLLDTQYLFAETEWFAQRLRERFDLNLRIVSPLPDVTPDDQWLTDAEGCCQRRKVEPLQRALRDRDVWITGLRRADGPSRADAPVAAHDIGRGVLKVNPLVALTDDDIELYHQLHDLPRNPLSERGYPSIGCWPCTRPVAPGEDKRAGRWSGSAKTECGLHA